MQMPTSQKIHDKVHRGNPKDWCGLCMDAGMRPPSKAVTTPKGNKRRRHPVLRSRRTPQERGA